MDARRDSTILAVRVTPGTKRNSITALKEGVWCVKIAAPPNEGKANEELVAFLSQILNVRKSSLSVIKGHKSRNKLMSVSGLSQKEVTLRLSAELNG